MRSESSDRAAQTILLSPSQAARTVAVIDKLCARQSDLAAQVEQLRDKLADATYLGTWLRDNVRVDFSSTDLAEMTHVLASLDHATDVPVAEQRAFCEIADMLQSVRRSSSSSRPADHIATELANR